MRQKKLQLRVKTVNWGHNTDACVNGPSCLCSCPPCQRRHQQKPIANGTESPQDGFSEPEPCQDVPLVHIRLETGGWCIAEGHVHSPIPDKDVATQPDPVVVALYLISHAKGPINVAW